MNAERTHLTGWTKAAVVLAILVSLMGPVTAGAALYFGAQKVREVELTQVRDEKLAAIAREEERIQKLREEEAAYICEVVNSYGFNDVYSVGYVYSRAEAAVQDIANERCDAGTKVSQNKALQDVITDAMSVGRCYSEDHVTVQMELTLKNPVDYAIDVDFFAAVLMGEFLVEEQPHQESALQVGEERSITLNFQTYGLTPDSCRVSDIAAIPTR